MRGLIKMKVIIWNIVFLQTFTLCNIFPMKKPDDSIKTISFQALKPTPPTVTLARPDGVPKDLWDRVSERIESIRSDSNKIISEMNRTMALAHNANVTASLAIHNANDALSIANKAKYDLSNTTDVLREIREVSTDVFDCNRRFVSRIDICNKKITETTDRESARIEKLRDETFQLLNSAHTKSNADIEIAKINELKRLGIFEQQEKIKAQGVIDAEKTKWEEIKKMISDPVFVAKIIVAAAGLSLAVYGMRYLVQYFIDRFKLPKVISQTSCNSWFLSNDYSEINEIDNLIFEPCLQKQLIDLSLRIKSSQEFNENLPNVLFYGPSGTGKTAFAKALAKSSGLDYALTSGSEFAKITDLNIVGDEFRKLLNWAKNSKSGLIIFIDEADSLFADRKIINTPKTAIDFINIFLSLISDQSQKKLMFIFATNYPFKIDDAILNRIGITIEFLLPTENEREKIFCEYLTQFSSDQEKHDINFDKQTIDVLSKSIKNIPGLTPREIKFIAQEIIFCARQQSGILSEDKINNVFNKIQNQSCIQEEWKKERNNWINSIY